MPWWWTIIALLFLLSLAVAVFAYVAPLVAGLFTGVAFLALVGGIAAYDLTAVGVSDGAVVAGRNRVEAEWISGVEALEGDAARAALGPEGDHRDFLFTRPYVTDLVRVTLADEADPHPAWLVSTRHPREFAAAVERMRSAA